MNNGWGVAKNCEIVIAEPTLNYFFTEEQRKFKGNITDGERKVIISLTDTTLDAGKFKEVHSRLIKAAWKEVEGELPKYLAWNRKYKSTQKLERDFEAYKKSEKARFLNQWICSDPWNSRSFKRSDVIAGNEDIDSLRIPIESPQVKWSCHDAHGNVKEGEDTAFTAFEEIFLTAKGIRSVYVDPPRLCARDSDTTYCTVLDPSLGPHTRDYAISREIRPGDVERFHILVGACKSSKLRLRFIFSIDKHRKITSDEFHIEIWNPRDSRLRYDYVDGEELERQARKNKKENDYSVKRRLEEYRSERRSNKLYPFIDPERNRRGFDPW